MNIYLVRHGETDYNRDHLLMGQLDIPLNETGLSQAKEVAKALTTKTISMIYTSDLVRATKTADSINNTRNIPIELVPNLREHTLGGLDGMKWSSEWDELEKGEFEERILKEGGEPFDSFSDRIWDIFLEKIALHPLEDNLLFVTHGGVIRLIIMKILGATEDIFSNLSIDNCSITEIVHLPERKRNKFRLTIINSNWYLN